MWLCLYDNTLSYVWFLLFFYDNDGMRPVLMNTKDR